MANDVISGRKGAWINQYAQPDAVMFDFRARQVDYLVIKYGLPDNEREAVVRGIPWLAERMGDAGADSVAIGQAETFAAQLSAQAAQEGCVGAVINLEEADGGWHTDNGVQTLKLVRKFRELQPNKPLYASLDTRGNRPNYPYQLVLAAQCDGVMPMVYPKAFGQTPQQAVEAALTPLFHTRWGGKPVVPTIQTYDGIGVGAIGETMFFLRQHSIAGVNAYTLGHATDEEWQTFVNTMLLYPIGPIVPPTPVDTNVRAQMLEARVKFLETMATLGLRGTPNEVLAFATFWKAASTS